MISLPILASLAIALLIIFAWKTASRAPTSTALFRVPCIARPAPLARQGPRGAWDGRLSENDFLFSASAGLLGRKKSIFFSR
jgi:hypothetical protein